MRILKRAAKKIVSVELHKKVVRPKTKFLFRDLVFFGQNSDISNSVNSESASVYKYLQISINLMATVVHKKSGRAVVHLPNPDRTIAPGETWANPDRG